MPTALEPDEVIEHYADMADEGARQFLLFATARSPATPTCAASRDGAAEFAFMIGAPTAQGKGLGTKFAPMIYAFAFDQLGFTTSTRRSFPRTSRRAACSRSSATRVDDSAAARGYADEPGDLVMAIDRATFHRHQRGSPRAHSNVKALTPLA